jgi:outer membrane protein OmpA-like peptidoglycan-associated protein
MSDDDDDDQDKEPPPIRDPAAALFLSLFMLLLAFFILLNTLSTLEKVKSRAVMDSLTSAFASIMPPAIAPSPFSSQVGEAISAAQSQELITKLFETAIPLVEISVVQPGRQMVVRMHPEALFETDSAEFRAGMQPFLDRLAAALSRTPKGFRYDVTYQMTTPTGRGGELPDSQTLAVLRSGVFARTLLARGAPKDAVSVGLMPGGIDRIEMFFHLRHEDEGKIDFHELAGR